MARAGGRGGRAGGGFHGGGFRGGGFGGHHYGHGNTTRFGTCASRFNLLLLPVWLLIFILVQCSNMPQTVNYNESTFEAFASSRYDMAFRESASYEDNLLLAFLVYEDRSDFSYMTWVGDHISDETFNLLGGNESLLGRTLENEIAYGYSSTLSSDFERVLDALADGILAASPAGSHTCTEDQAGTGSYLINDSELALHDSRLNNALADFTARTGIPIVLVVEDAADIFN